MLDLGANPLAHARMDWQFTVSGTATCEGVGLHTGAPVTLTIRGAGAGEGISFLRTDAPVGTGAISALGANVARTELGTNLANIHGRSVATVEHFLAACAGMGVDNLVAELNGPELPIMDGSALPFCDLIAQAGLSRQDAPRRRLVVLKAVEVADGPRRARLSPGEGFEAKAEINFNTRAIGQQSYTYQASPENFRNEIAFARTFGFARDLDRLRAMGLARGGSLENAIGIEGDTILNPEGLRAPDEFVRHKLLDVIGDLFLAGGPIEGRYQAEQPGHALNERLLSALFAEPGAAEWRIADHSLRA